MLTVRWPSTCWSPPTSRKGSRADGCRPAVTAHAAGAALALSPTDFERLVVVLERMGYGRSGAVEHSGQPGDAGNAVVGQDPLGLDRIFVQAKRYALDHAVQRPAAQAFVGARREAERVNARIELIDEDRLAALVLQYGVGVQAEVTVTLHRVDEDFFDVF